MAGPQYLADSNILLRLFNRDDPAYRTVRMAVEGLADRHITLVYTMQNMAEFWNAPTRSKEHMASA